MMCRVMKEEQEINRIEIEPAQCEAYARLLDVTLEKIVAEETENDADQ